MKVSRFLLFAVFLVLVSCQKVFLGDDPKSTPNENFESLWSTLDQKYSFFSYKEIDWDKVYAKYSAKIDNSMDDSELFDVFYNMLSELRDGHVNLTSPFNVSRYDKIFTNSPHNYDERLVSSNYLKKDYYVSGPFYHQLIAKQQVGYIRYSSFMNSFSASNLDYIINRFKNLKGIIIDVRDNGGGYISNVFTLCSRFADQRRHVYTSYMKNGPAHEDFKSPEDIYMSPDGATFTNKICILTNRGSFSATSFFVLAMRNFPHVTVVGDTTGGGLGIPSGAELPNGWSYRFSASKTLSVEGENFEDGIPPDAQVNLKTTDIAKGVDTIIEKAVAIILSN